MSDSDNNCTGNQCPYGFKHEDFNKVTVSPNSKCPLGYIQKDSSVPTAESNQCPYGFKHEDFDKFSISPNSKCPLGYVKNK